jgi:hypothetical protein
MMSFARLCLSQLEHLILYDLYDYAFYAFKVFPSGIKLLPLCFYAFVLSKLQKLGI